MFAAGDERSVLHSGRDAQWEAGFDLDFAAIAVGRGRSGVGDGDVPSASKRAQQTVTKPPGFWLGKRNR